MIWGRWGVPERSAWDAQIGVLLSEVKSFRRARGRTANVIHIGTTTTVEYGIPIHAAGYRPVNSQKPDVAICLRIAAWRLHCCGVRRTPVLTRRTHLICRERFAATDWCTIVVHWCTVLVHNRWRRSAGVHLPDPSEENR